MERSRNTGNLPGIGRSSRTTLPPGEQGEGPATMARRTKSPTPSRSLNPVKGESPPPEKVRLVNLRQIGEPPLIARVKSRVPQTTILDGFPTEDAERKAGRLGDWDRFITEREAASILGVSVRTLQAWRYDSKGRGPTHSKFQKCVRYRLSALYEWTSRHEITAR